MSSKKKLIGDKLPKTISFRIFGLALIFLSCSNLIAQGFLRVDGDKIVNDNDQNYILKGMNLGGWLVQEGYMLHTGEKDAEHQIREAIRELVGEERTVELYELYHKNYVRKIDIDSLAAWRFNSIRLPMHWNKLVLQKEYTSVLFIASIL